MQAELLSPPRVYAYEVAEELGCSESAVSKFLNRGHRGKRLPHGQGVESFKTAMRRLKARKGAAA